MKYHPPLKPPWMWEQLSQISEVKILAFKVELSAFKTRDRKGREILHIIKYTIGFIIVQGEEV